MKNKQRPQPIRVKDKSLSGMVVDEGADEAPSSDNDFVEFIKSRHDGSLLQVSLFDLVIDISEFTVAVTDWTDEQHKRVMTAFGTLALLSWAESKDLFPQLFEFLDREHQRVKTPHIFSDFQAEFFRLSAEARIRATEFMKNRKAEDARYIWQEFGEYEKIDIILSLAEFLVAHKFCCRMCMTAWRIPRAASIGQLIGLISYAAVWLAEIMNDPLQSFKCDCTSVGSSWLHRLGVYLLYLCSTHKMPPPFYLIELMALVTAPSSSSLKIGKSFRMISEFQPSHYPMFLHESPPDIAIGTQLALELLGEFDPNRQPEYFRRLERAVACYAHDLMFTGQRPSVRRVQLASGMSWADAKAAMEQRSFSRMVFVYQCRYPRALHISETCPQCREVVDRMQGMKATPR